jgi:hypothetical protein
MMRSDWQPMTRRQVRALLAICAALILVLAAASIAAGHRP